MAPAGSAGAALVQQCFSALEDTVQAARTYRGKILSLDADPDYRGRSRGIDDLRTRRGLPAHRLRLCHWPKRWPESWHRPPPERSSISFPIS